MKYIIKKNKTIFKKSVFELKESEVEIDTFSKGKDIIHRFELNVPEVVAALIYIEEQEKIVLVEQFRYSSIKKCSGWVMEIVAGLIEKNESSASCLKREIFEETGYKIKKFRKILNFFPNVGFSNQYIHFYLVWCNEKDKVETGGGVKEEKEDIKVYSFTTEEIKKKIQNNEFIDSKTIIGLQWFILNEEKIKKNYLLP